MYKMRRLQLDGHWRAGGPPVRATVGQAPPSFYLAQDTATLKCQIVETQPAAGSSIKVVGAAHSTKASTENVASSTPATVAATKNSDIATQTTTGAATTARPARNTNEQWYAPNISASPRSCTDRGLRSHVVAFSQNCASPCAASSTTAAPSDDRRLIKVCQAKARPTE